MRSRNVISVLMPDRPGALTRLAEVFGSRGYNVESICSGSCEEQGCQRLTIVCNESDSNVKTILKQLDSLIDVWQVKLVSPEDEISREMMLAKVSLDKNNRSEIISLLNLLKVEIIAIENDFVTFEVAKTASEIDNICASLTKYKIIEIARTGEAAIQK